MKYLNHSITDIKKLGKSRHKEYINAEPFPNITFDNFFDEDFLTKVADEFPDLSKQRNIIKYNTHNEKKLAAKGESLFGYYTRLLAYYLNSQPVLEFLQELTGIKEILLPDPYFVGGGYHEIKPGGLLKIHADFNKNDLTGLDRRINLLVYLNKDWDESYGGHFELWDKDMRTSRKKTLPLFNRVAIFSTTDFSYHGHPEPLTCPPHRSRKSLAFYYYTNGRPQNEINMGEHSTLFMNRAGMENDTVVLKQPVTVKGVVRDCIPPVVIKIAKKVLKKD